MKQHYIDERTGISYTLQGDYYLPGLVLPNENETNSIGIWGNDTFGASSSAERCSTPIY